MMKSISEMMLMRRSKKSLNKSSWQSDGNGGYNIQKGTFALFTVLIALISCVATVVAFGATIKSDVSWLKDTVISGIPEQRGTINHIEARLDICEKHIVSSEITLQNIHEDILEMKEDIKELIK